MPITVLDPLALRVARRYLTAVQSADRRASAMPDHRASTFGRVGREYQRRGEGLVPVNEEDGDEEDDGAGAGRDQ
jgi:hypothetical protein